MYEIKPITLDIQVVENKLCLLNFEALQTIVNDNKSAVEEAKITSENYRTCKDWRATLNNTDKALTKAESDFKKDFMNDFLTKSSSLKSSIKEVSKELDTKIKEYERANGLEKPTLKYLTIKSYDLELLNKINAIIEENFKIKGEIK